MTNEAPHINAGVEGGSGYEFQRNCLIFILLDEYDYFREKRYFICMESADDFIICFLENNELKEVRTYQAKKKSNGNWTIRNMMQDEIIPKMCEGGLMVQEDKSFPHADSYTQKLHFLSNQIIKLNNKICNEASEIVKYDDLEEKTKKAIKKSINEFYTEDKEKEHIDKILDQRKYLIFKFIDLNKKIKEQKNCLKGKIEEVFNSNVPNPQAALDTIIHSLTISSTTYNTNKQFDLSQKDKWVTSESIQDCFGTITTKSKFFERWRNKVVKDNICHTFKIPVCDQSQFESQCNISFDLFKDPNQVEHQNILKLANELKTETDIYSEEDLTNKILLYYKTDTSISFSELEIKAIAYAAAIQVLN